MEVVEREWRRNLVFTTAKQLEGKNESYQKNRPQISVSYNT
jgi:hypothetical protein